MMPAFYGAALKARRPRPPDGQDVTVKLFKIVPRGPKAQSWTLHSSTCRSVRFIMLSIDCQTSSIVFHHPVHGGWVGDCQPEIFKFFLTHALR